MNIIVDISVVIEELEKLHKKNVVEQEQPRIYVEDYPLEILQKKKAKVPAHVYEVDFSIESNEFEI